MFRRRKPDYARIDVLERDMGMDLDSRQREIDRLRDENLAARRKPNWGASRGVVLEPRSVPVNVLGPFQFADGSRAPLALLGATSSHAPGLYQSPPLYGQSVSRVILP